NFLHHGCFLQNFLSLGNDPQPHVGDTDFRPAPFEQHHTKLLLKLADGHRECGLTDEAGFGCPPEMALSCDGDDVFEFCQSHKLSSQPGLSFYCLTSEQVFSPAHPALQMSADIVGMVAQEPGGGITRLFDDC